MLRRTAVERRNGSSARRLRAEFLAALHSTLPRVPGRCRKAEGELRQTTALSRRMLLETLEPRILLSADLNPIDGSIDVPGETDRYAFSLTQPRRIYFDSLTDSDRINWTLSGPRGTEVQGRRFNSSDSADLSGAAVLE